jgi:flagellar export protein FliJ
MGKAFTFRAQPALDLRRREYDARLRAVATAQFELATERRRYDEACNTVCAAVEEMGRRMQGVQDAAVLTWHRVWIERLERARDAHAEVVAEKDARVALARQRLESLERLKGKARRAWDDAERVREQREFDALATMRYGAAARDAEMRSAV